MNAFKKACSVAAVKNMLASGFTYKKTDLSKEVFGLKFKNPVGLGAGFDKNARYLTELETMGFGSVEIGTVTPLAQPGNEQPRLFRLPKDKALINRMGFNNDGVEAVAARLKEWRNKNASTELIIGGNIGKNKVTDNEDAHKDYIKCFEGLYETSDYFVVNVSSPNTPGLRALQEKDALEKILGSVQHANHGKPKAKPLLLKIAPDLTREQVDDIIDLASAVQLNGLVATNTTISRDNLLTEAYKIKEIGAGGLSGKPLMEQSTEILQYLTANLPKEIPVIASGGIFTGADAREKLDAGAALLQVWTGFIYEGPAIAKNICTYLAASSNTKE